jgi:hypothetical protein
MRRPRRAGQRLQTDCRSIPSYHHVVEAGRFITSKDPFRRRSTRGQGRNGLNSDGGAASLHMLVPTVTSNPNIFIRDAAAISRNSAISEGTPVVIAVFENAETCRDTS